MQMANPLGIQVTYRFDKVLVGIILGPLHLLDWFRFLIWGSVILEIP